jgi:hypothetical protein
MRFAISIPQHVPDGTFDPQPFALIWREPRILISKVPGRESRSLDRCLTQDRSRR